MVSIDIVKELRERTGISVMQCKKALEEANGNVEQALVILRKHAVKAAEKKGDRTLGAAIIQAYIHNNEVGAMVELSCETDFVAKNEDFIALAREIAMHIAASNPQSINREDLNKESYKAAQEVFEKELADKPENIKSKIMQGKLDAYTKEIVLLEQPFIKDQERSIKDLIEEATQKFGEKIAVTRFARFSARD
ncbi:MAG TPA: elongation factor Ts [Candidatus Paceibacterota bacterium]